MTYLHLMEKKVKYRSYWEIRKGKLYGSVSIPNGDGTYKRKVKRVDTKTEARQWAQAELGKSVMDPGEMTFRDLAEWYKREFLVPPEYKDGKKLHGLRTWKSQRWYADALAEVFGDLDLTEIDVDLLRGYKKKRLVTREIATVNRELALLRTMFKKAKQRKWIAGNPFDSGEKLIETALESKRTSPLTPRIAKRLLARARKSEQPLLHYLILVMMHTGARPSEVFPFHAHDESVRREPLTWGAVLDYDFKAVRLVSYKGRVRHTRCVPATRELESGLRKFHGEKGPNREDLLFPVKSFKRAWNTLCRSVGVEGIWLRDFRKYYNSVIMQNPNINDMERLLLLGHSEIKTNMTYSQLDEGFVKKYREVV